LQITSLEPITDILIRLERKHEGWTFWCRHKHYAGTLLDCPVLEVSALSDAELLDVIDAHVAGLEARTVSSS
jgi:hypothetical protein